MLLYLIYTLYLIIFPLGFYPCLLLIFSSFLINSLIFPLKKKIINCRRDSFITHRAFCDALAAAEESGRYNSHTFSLPSPHLLHSLSSLKRDPPSAHVSFPPWLSSSSSSSVVGPPSLPSQQPGPHLFATLDDSAGPTSLLPQMSATALLQKAAEMGVTLMSGATSHLQEAAHHVTSSSSGMCSSRDQGQCSSVLHDMIIINSLQSTSPSGGGFEGGLGFGDHHHHDQMMMHHQHGNNQGHQGVVTSGKPPMPPFHGGRGGGGSGGGGGDGLSTRDFLGLRTFSHKDFINMAGLGAQINSSSNSAPSFDNQQQQLHHDHQQQHNHDGRQNQTPW